MNWSRPTTSATCKIAEQVMEDEFGAGLREASAAPYASYRIHSAMYSWRVLANMASSDLW